MSVPCIVSIVMCVHVGQSALQRCGKKKKKNLLEFNQGSDLFSETLQRFADTLQPGLPTLSRSRPAVADVRPPAFVAFKQTPCQYLLRRGSDLFRVSASFVNGHPPLPRA